MLLVILSLITLALWYTKKRAIHSQYFTVGNQALHQIRDRVEMLMLHNLESNLNYLINMPDFKMLISGHSDLLAEVGQHWTTLADAQVKGAMLELCWIDPDGTQRLCVDRYQGKAMTTAQTALKNVNTAEYFRETHHQPPSFQYISPIRLDEREGVLTKPFTPVQQLARPVFDSVGNRRGVLAIKINVTELLADAKNVSRYVWMVDGEGHFLIGDGSNEWNDQLGRPETTLKSGFPLAWQFMQSGHPNRFETSQGLWQFQIVQPFSRNPGFYWYLVHFVPGHDYWGILWLYTRTVITVAFVLMLLLLPICWELASRRGLQKKIRSKQREVERLTNESRLFQEMIETLASPFYILSLEDGRMLYVNDAALKHYGATRDEVLSWHIPDWDPQYPVENLPALLEHDQHQTQRCFETVHRLADGREVPVEVHANTACHEGQWISYGIFQDLSELKSHQQSLIDARDAAEAASGAKTTFLSFMSHELRTPLNAILGFAQLLESDADELNEEQRDFVTEIIVSGQLLLSLINDILDLTKIGAGKLNIEQNDVSVHAVIRECVSMTRRMADSARVSVSLSESIANAPLVAADHLRLKQVIINLLHNAIKYNHKEGMVFIDVQMGESDDLRINIIDTGIGISDERQKNIFMSFERLGMESSGIEGTGIGLIIAKTMIHLMNGRIGFTSVLGKGSHFWIQLPLAQGPLRETMPEPSPSEDDSIAFFTQ